MSQNYFDFDPDPAYYHPNSYRPEFHKQYEEVFEERSISPECDDPVILFDINKEVRKRSEED